MNLLVRRRSFVRLIEKRELEGRFQVSTVHRNLQAFNRNVEALIFIIIIIIWTNLEI